MIYYINQIEDRFIMITMVETNKTYIIMKSEHLGNLCLVNNYYRRILDDFYYSLSNFNSYQFFRHEYLLEKFPFLSIILHIERNVLQEKVAILSNEFSDIYNGITLLNYTKQQDVLNNKFAEIKHLKDMIRTINSYLE